MSGSTLAKFGKRLRDLRQRKGLSQEKLAELAGLHRTYVGSVERGERNISLVNMVALASALEISLSSLMQTVDFDPSAARSGRKLSR